MFISSKTICLLFDNEADHDITHHIPPNINPVKIFLLPHHKIATHTIEKEIKPNIKGRILKVFKSNQLKLHTNTIDRETSIPSIKSFAAYI